MNKYRIYNKTSKQFDNPNDYAISSGGSIIQNFCYDDNPYPDWQQLDFIEGYQVQYSTGLFDQDDTEIYEGDIVTSQSPRNFEIFKVKYGIVERPSLQGDTKINIPCFYFESRTSKLPYFWESECSSNVFCKETTHVAGNIFKNPFCIE